MEYLCLIYHAANTLEALPESAYDALIDDSVAYDEELLRRGQYIGSVAYPAQADSHNHSRSGGRISISDGRFVVAGEQLGGFYVIEARDLNDAIRMVAMLLATRLGCVEVRPFGAFKAEWTCRQEAIER